MPEWALFTVGLLLTVGTGLFVASEFALVNLDRAELEARRDRGEGNLTMTISALKRTSTHLSSAQLGITLTTLLAGYTLEPALSAWLRLPLQALGLPDAAVQPVALVTAVAIATLLSMIVGELVPKNFALAIPRQVAKLVIPFQLGFTFLFRPVVTLLNGTANAVLRGIGIEPKEELSGARSAEELSFLVQRSALEGTLDKDTATLLTRTLEFNELTAGEVMTSRPQLATVAAGAMASELIALARTTGFSRFPVIGDDADDVVGIVHIKQAVALPREKRDTVPVAALMQDALRVPETMHLDALLAQLRGHGYQLALVVDEYGGTAGIATLEDLVEELVGELIDEHDRAQLDLVRRGEDLVFSGLLRPDELEERAGLRIPEDSTYETVAGFLMSELGRIPEVGDEVGIEGGVLRVERLDGRRVDRIRFVPVPDSDTDPDAVEGGVR